MERRERHLGGPGEEQLVIGQPVELLLGVGQEAGPVQRALADEHRWDDGFEAVRSKLLDRPPDERELEEHEVAPEIGEARARELRPGIHVDHRPRELEVVAGLEVELWNAAHLAHQLIFGPGRRGGVGQVGERHERCLECLVHLRELALELLRARRHLAHRLDLALALGGVGRRADARVRRVLLAAQALELGQQRTPARVELDHSVDRPRDVLAAARERRAHLVGFLPDAFEVEHA